MPGRSSNAESQDVGGITIFMRRGSSGVNNIFDDAPEEAQPYEVGIETPSGKRLTFPPTWHENIARRKYESLRQELSQVVESSASMEKFSGSEGNRSGSGIERKLDSVANELRTLGQTLRQQEQRQPA